VSEGREFDAQRLMGGSSLTGKEDHGEQPRPADTNSRDIDPREQDPLGEAREYHEKKDPEDNRNTTPPDDERIEVHSVWVAECYAPSHTASLMAGIRGLGWDQERVTDFFKGGVSGWLNEGRKSPYGGAYLNLSPIERPGQRRFIGPEIRVADLPDSVDYARGYAFNILSSLTIITLQFVLTDEAATVLEDTLRTPLRTVFEEEGDTTRIITVVNGKQEAVHRARVNLRSECATWFKENIPGLFSEGSLDGDFPTCEFITLQQARPFERSPKGTPIDNYKWLLGMEHDSDAWNSSSLPGLRLEVPTRGFQQSPYALVLAGKKDEIASDEDLSMYGGRNRNGYTGWLDQRIDGVLSVWSLQALLAAYEQRLAVLRDQAGGLSFREPADTANQLQSIQTDLVRLSSDLLPMSSELAEFSDTKWRIERLAEEFLPVMQFLRDRGLQFTEDLRQNILDRSKRLRALEEEVRQVLTISGTVASTISQERATSQNLRLQGEVALLTKVLVFLTVVLVAIGIITIWATVQGG
jgi:hypothetical protein